MLYRYIIRTFYYSWNLLHTFDQEKNSAWPSPRNRIAASVVELKYCMWKIYEHANKGPGKAISQNYIGKSMQREPHNPFCVMRWRTMRSLMANVRVILYFPIMDSLLPDYVNDHGKLSRFYELNGMRFPTAVFSQPSVTEHLVTTLVTGKIGELNDNSDFFSICHNRVSTVEFQDYSCFKNVNPSTVLYVCNGCGNGIKKSQGKFIVRQFFNDSHILYHAAIACYIRQVLFKQGSLDVPK